MTERPNVLWPWYLAAAAVAAVVVYLLSPILAPFLLAAILAYIFDPLVDRLEARRVPRSAGAVLVAILIIALLIVLVLILVPVFVREVGLLSQKLPGIWTRIDAELMPWLQQRFGIDLKLNAEELRGMIAGNIGDFRGIAGKVFASISVGGLAILGFIANLLLVPVVFFYLLRDWDLLIGKVEALIPRRLHARVSVIAREIDAVLAEFLRGQLTVMVTMAIFYTIGLWIAGLDFALPIGIITGLLVFVPYVGYALGLLLGTLVAFLQFGAAAGLIWVWVVFGIGQVVESFLVTPWLVGERIGLHPVAVIFALLAFGQIFGFFGILLALPASAALLVGMRHLLEDYAKSALFRE